jgi:hypothetical protein
LRKLLVINCTEGPVGPHGIALALWNLPALLPPPGRKPNFDHPENKDTQIIIMNSVFLALMLISVAVRFLNSKPQERQVTWDKSTSTL